MGLMPTMRTGEAMALSYAAQPTTRTVLARVGGIDLSNTHPTFLCLVLDTGAKQTTLPQRQAASECLAAYLALLRLGDMQVLKHENRMLRCPPDEVFGGLLGK